MNVTPAESGWDTSVGELMGLFWKSLRAITPTLLETRFELGDDGWDAVTEALFDQIVEESIRYSDAVAQRDDFDLPSFEFEYDPTTVSYIEVTHRPSGSTGAFLRYTSEYEWPDFTIVRCVGIDEGWRLHECDWACVVKADGEELRLTELRVEAPSNVAAGAQPLSRPDVPAKQRMSVDEWQRWWKFFGREPLRHLLLLYWDPIGCFGHPEGLDEYDSYADEVGLLLGEGASLDAITNYLTTTSNDQIGMPSPNSHAAALRVVEWFDESIQTYGDRLYLAQSGRPDTTDDLRDRLVAALDGPEPARFLISLGEALTISARGGYEVLANSVAWLSGHNEIQHRLFPQVASILRGKAIWSATDFAGVVLGSAGYHSNESRQAVRWAVENALMYWDPDEDGDVS